ncbi:MAG: L,D-transpeptidase [Verrucomicrobiota bacterium]
MKNVLNTIQILTCCLLPLLLASCLGKDRANVLYISVPEQRAVLEHHGEPVAYYGVSTSKYGLGSQPGSYRTPLGRMEIAKKIGAGKPAGTVFKSRKPTGEILPPNAPGRDPIVTRILWLRGLESHNRNAYDRYIYIHGTPEERNIGRAVSYGCIRMKSAAVIDLYNRVGNGAQVIVANAPLSEMTAESSTD